MRLTQTVKKFLVVLLLTGVTGYALGAPDLNSNYNYILNGNNPIENQDGTVGQYSDDLTITYGPNPNNFTMYILGVEQTNLTVNTAGCQGGRCKMNISGPIDSPGNALITIGNDWDHYCRYSLADSYDDHLRLTNLACIGGYHTNPVLFLRSHNAIHGKYATQMWWVGSAELGERFCKHAVNPSLEAHKKHPCF